MTRLRLLTEKLCARLKPASFSSEAAAEVQLRSHDSNLQPAALCSEPPGSSWKSLPDLLASLGDRQASILQQLHCFNELAVVRLANCDTQLHYSSEEAAPEEPSAPVLLLAGVPHLMIKDNVEIGLNDLNLKEIHYWDFKVPLYAASPSLN